MKMELNYFFNGDYFAYDVDDEFVKRHFGDKPDDETVDDWMDEVCEYFVDEARSEYEQICKENSEALEALKEDYMRSV